MEQLSEKTGISIGQIFNYEKGIKAPGYWNLLKLIEVFDESADYIMGLTDTPRLKKII